MPVTLKLELTEEERALLHYMLDSAVKGFPDRDPPEEVIRHFQQDPTISLKTLAAKIDQAMVAGDQREPAAEAPPTNSWGAWLPPGHEALASLPTIRPEFEDHLLNEDGERDDATIAMAFSDLLNKLMAPFTGDGSDALLPIGRERALVITHLQEAMFWARRGIAMLGRNQQP